MHKSYESTKFDNKEYWRELQELKEDNDE